VLLNNESDLQFSEKRIKKGIIKEIESVAETQFFKVPYTEAIKMLQESGKKFELSPEWGVDLATEHEKYLCDNLKKPVVVYDYPKDIKPFYMRVNDDGKTVAAMDVLVPGIGEVIGGSQREERLDLLSSRLEECNLSPEQYWWYLDLRKYGSIPHSGFGVGLERLVMMLSGVDNIRDAIPFPRWPGNAKF